MLGAGIVWLDRAERGGDNVRNIFHLVFGSHDAGMYRVVPICCCYLGFVSSCVDARELSTYTVCGELRGLGGTYQQYRCV